MSNYVRVCDNFNPDLFFQIGWIGKVHCQAKETQKVNSGHFVMFYANYLAVGNTPGESILTPPLPGAG